MSFGSDMTYKGVPIAKSDSDEVRLKSQFCQAILDNLEQRFPGTTFLNAAQVLDPASWPDDPVDNALFGENALVQLCKQYSLSVCD